MNENDKRPNSGDFSLGDDNESLLTRHRQAQSSPAPERAPRRTPDTRVSPGEATRQSPSQRPPNPPQGRPPAARSAAGPSPAKRPEGAPYLQRRPSAPATPIAPKNVQERMPVKKTESQAPVLHKRPMPPKVQESKAVTPKAPSPVPEAPAYSARREKTGTVSSEFTPKSARAPHVKRSEKNAADTSGSTVMMVSIIKAITYMVVVLVISIFLSIFAIRVGNDVFAFVKSDEAIDVTIPDDASIGDISSILYDNGIIRYPSMFKLYASIKHDTGGFVAGSYTVSPAMSYDDLRDAFREHVATGTSWITIPEGYTTDEIIDLLVSKGIGKKENYVDVINNYDFDYWFVSELTQNGIPEGRLYRLDGYLFPDTYEFYNASSEKTVIGRMLARFNEVFVADYKTRADEMGLSVDQIVNIAALIEKEAGSAADYMYVSSVFHNRLENPSRFPNLESDATTVYGIQAATGVRPEAVTPEETKTFDSLYNTYLHPGLTPGPITNPGASAIRYALYPADTNYYYFVTANNGSVYYASSLQEHNANIEAVKAMNEEK